MYEPGVYWIEIVDHRIVESRKKIPQMMIAFRVLSRVNTSDPEGSAFTCDQYERSMWKSITDKTIDWLKQDVQYLLEQGGLDDSFDRMDRLDSQTPGCLQFIGIKCQARCNSNTFEGKTTDKWGLGYEPEGGKKLDINLLDNAGVRKLDALFGKQLKSNSAPKSAPPPADQNQQNPATEIGPQSSYTAADVDAVAADKDIPF